MLHASGRRLVRLAAVPDVAPGRESALAAARSLFARGERIEMGALAEQLGVNRVTLYRWLGNRETLLAELLWERLERALHRADARATDAGLAGVERLVAALMGIFPHDGTGSAERAFIAREPALAMRVMTTGVVHDRLVAWFAAAIDAERDAGRVNPAHPSEQIADIVVKSGEAVYWFDVASGRGVQRDNVVVVLGALCPPVGPR